jgi:hypothetical protein
LLLSLVILPLSKQAHDEYHADAVAGAERYGSLEILLKRFWASIGFEPGPFMIVGMAPKRAAWLERVMQHITLR